MTTIVTCTSAVLVAADGVAGLCESQQPQQQLAVRVHADGGREDQPVGTFRGCSGRNVEPGHIVHRPALRFQCFLRHTNAQACHQFEVGVESVPGVTWHIGPTPQADDGVSRRTVHPTDRWGLVVQFQYHPLNRSKETKAGHAVVGHFQKALDLPDGQTLNPPQRLNQFEALDVSGRILHCGSAQHPLSSGKHDRQLCRQCRGIHLCHYRAGTGHSGCARRGPLPRWLTSAAWWS